MTSVASALVPLRTSTVNVCLPAHRCLYRGLKLVDSSSCQSIENSSNAPATKWYSILIPQCVLFCPQLACLKSGSLASPWTIHCSGHRKLTASSRRQAENLALFEGHSDVRHYYPGSCTTRLWCKQTFCGLKFVSIYRKLKQCSCNQMVLHPNPSVCPFLPTTCSKCLKSGSLASPWTIHCSGHRKLTASSRRQAENLALFEGHSDVRHYHPGSCTTRLWCKQTF